MHRSTIRCERRLRCAGTRHAIDAPLARIDRGSPLASDTAWARDRAHTLVRWPARFDSSGWRTRARVDTVGALLAGEGDAAVVVVSPFARTVDPAPGRVIARWVDGTAAATEHALGAGCVRDVAIPIARAGDLALRESTRRLVATLASPCGGSRELRSRVRLRPRAAPRHRLRSSPHARSSVAPRRADISRRWLLAGALALLLLEPLLRRQRAPA